MKRAFTLVELLVVLSVIAVLLAIALPGLARARQAARDVACRSNLRQLHTATLAQWVNEGERSLPAPPAELGTSGAWLEPLHCSCRWQGERVAYTFVAWTVLTEGQLARPDSVTVTNASGARVPWDFPLWGCPMAAAHAGHPALVAWSGEIR